MRILTVTITCHSTTRGLSIALCGTFSLSFRYFSLDSATMPPRSSTQVIESGEYLEPNFDANSLTMPHLLSIFTFHQVKYPVPYNKSKLVETFNEQVKPRADQFKRDRLKREGSVASSRGITDGLTGKSLSDVRDVLLMRTSAMSCF